MRGVTEGIENGCNLVGDIVGYLERIEGRYGQIFRKCAGPVDAHTRCIAAQVAPACPAVAAITAGDVPFARNTVADLEAADLLAYFQDRKSTRLNSSH